jgi:predicted ATP-grasp superfamily ATP-dependent carboligase
MSDTKADRLATRSIRVAEHDSANSERAAIEAPASHDAIETRNPRILLVATVRWPLAARLAISFHSLGCSVQAWCPAGHPLEKTRAVDRVHRYRALTPQRSLRTAILDATPDFVVPCDDDAAIHLQRLHDCSDEAARVRTLIRRSLGTPSSCARATARGKLMDLALAERIRIPATGRLSCAADLEDWGAENGFPAVIKVDHSWGGLGVTVVRSIEQARDALRSAFNPSLFKALSSLIVRRDPSPLLAAFRRERPSVTVQKFIVGTPANRAVACWQGEVLAGISVAALQTRSPTGPATVVQVIDNEDMTAAATKLIRALGLTGLCGLDFVIEADTNAAYLIELNPRATPICHLPLGAGHHLPLALYSRLVGKRAASIAPAIGNGVIAMFPAEWLRDPLSPYLRSAFHDVPWTEIGLVRDCVDLPWEDRGIAARIKARLRPTRPPASPSFPLRSCRSTLGDLREP